MNVPRPFRVFPMVLLASLAAAAPADDAAARRRQIEGWLLGLINADYAVRDAARRSLMELQPYELAIVRDLATARRLRPAQADALRSVVVHVIGHAFGRAMPLHGAPYIGIIYGPSDVEPAPDTDGKELPPIGVTVYQIVPGSPAERGLLVGDVLLGTEERWGDVAQSVWFDATNLLADRVSGSRPGETITFHVRRAGRVLRVGVTPEPRPLPTGVAGSNDTVALMAVMGNARLDALRVFDEQFGPLCVGKEGP